MEKEIILKAIKQAKDKAKKRKFVQKIDLIFNFKSLDLKKPEDQLDFYFQLPYATGEKKKVCAFVAGELLEQAKKSVDKVIFIDDFDKYKDNKKEQKKLVAEYDFFIAQANIMPRVAAVFGRILGPKNKMPNPKAGCVVPPNANLSILFEKLQKTQRVLAKKSPIFQCYVGTEESEESEVADNISAICDQVVHHLPSEKNNLRSIFLKLTMGGVVHLPVN